MSDNITYKEVNLGGIGHWVAMRNGQVIAKAMSEAGVRSMVMAIANKKKKEND